MTAHVVVSVDYPEVAPMFLTSVAWQTQRTADTDIHVKVRHFSLFAQILFIKRKITIVKLEMFVNVKLFIQRFKARD